MTLAFVGDSVPLGLTLADYSSAYFPRVRIYDGATLLTTINLTFVDLGFYYGTWTPTYDGRFVAVYDTYSDVGHTTLATRYLPDTEEIQVFAHPLATEDGAIRQSFTLDAVANNIIVNLWAEIEGVQVSTGISAATLVLYKHDGTVMASPATQASPIAQGVFRFIFPVPPLALGENATFSVATVVFAGPPVRTLRGVTGVTFSRSA